MKLKLDSERQGWREHTSSPSPVRHLIGHHSFGQQETSLLAERDERFPIRVTVQFYQATSNGVVSPADMEIIASQIKRVYSDADILGILVVVLVFKYIWPKRPILDPYFEYVGPVIF